jgi:regulator of RNase E activity RraA
VGGTVIEGVCRDVAASLETAYPVFARSRNMQTGKDRVRLASTGRPVRLGSVLVRPGDVVCGDADGIVVLAGSQAERVLDVAERIAAAEERIRAAVAAGQRLDAARAAEGYHQLQTVSAGMHARRLR